MSEYNVECLRCGRQWYSDKFEKKGKVPDTCPRCYRSEVREIPPPPTKADILARHLREFKKQIPQKVHEKKHKLIIWREQNRFLISLIATGFVMIVLVAILVYALFFM